MLSSNCFVIILPMNSYELTLVIDPDVSAGDQKKLVEKIEKLITTAKGKVEKTAEWGKKELAYPIQKKLVGYFYFLTFNLSPAALSEIDQAIRLENQIMRYLLIKSEVHAHGATITK